MVDQSLLPGRLGNDELRFETDSRADPRIAEVVKLLGGFGAGIEPLPVDATYEQCLDHCMAFENAQAAAHPEMFANMRKFDAVVVTEKTILGVDGNDITLHIHQPKDRTSDLPGVVHIHGGGMVMMTAADPSAVLWRNILAEQGIVVIGVEYRNGGGQLGNHPFPAGLNDCAASLRWAHQQRHELQLSSVTLSGESGGGNLSIATALKANVEGWVDEIDGVYAMCPYIYGGYAAPSEELLSLFENDDYMLGCSTMRSMAKVYDPEGVNSLNPLAWPYHASIAELQGLPAHLISVNELDPLRDEGLVFYRKLLAAGVPVSARTVNGTPHAGDMGFVDVTPEITADTVASIAAFVRAR
ncbi:MAG: alpha/beta hydrolase [Rhodospirillaceae bacterium]|nr:alpha/beta hydrolase [Rhodospirillaceae bacterium]